MIMNNEDNATAANAAWITKHQYSLVPDADIVLVSLTGQDYPNLRAAFGEAWERLGNNADRKLLMLRSVWDEIRDSEELPFPKTPWIVALPHWPCREPDEFGLTDPPGLSIRFIAPLIERMPEELAIGVVARELGYAHWFVTRTVTADPMWAHQPRSAWDAKMRPSVKAFERAVGCKDLSIRLAKWAEDKAVTELGYELEAEAFMYFELIGQHEAAIGM
jgi:hypothetical protein